MNFLEFKTRKSFQPKHKNRKLKAPKEKHDSDINGFVKDIKTRRKQIKKMMNGNIDKDYLFEQVIAVENKEYPEIIFKYQLARYNRDTESNAPEIFPSLMRQLQN